MYCTLSTIYDDSDLATDSESYIGHVLKDQEEMRALDKVVDSIDTFFQKYDEEMTDEECIGKPEWQAVLATSKVAYDLIRKRNPSTTLPTEDETKS